MRRNSRERFRADYIAGLNDHEIGRKHGVSHDNVRKWRLASNLPPHLRQRRSGSLAKIIRPLLWRKSVAEIAAKAKCRPEYVRAFRQREAKRATR